MRQDINIINNQKGGVWEIVKKLNEQGNDFALTSFKNLKYFLANKDNHLYFHQPKSHLFALLLLFLGRKKSSMSIILHECSDYNNIGTLTSYFNYRSRFFIIRLLYYLNVNIYSVSDYISRSYNLNKIQKVKYTDLFYDEINRSVERYSRIHKNEHIALAWLRLGTSNQTVELISKLHLLYTLEKIYLIGNPLEIEIATLESQRLFPSIVVVSFEYLPKDNFFKLLAESRWFISTYSKEGFGLAVFEACKFSCICLVSESGGLTEWLPKLNYKALNFILDSKLVENDLMKQTIINNKNIIL